MGYYRVCEAAPCAELACGYYGTDNTPYCPRHATEYGFQVSPTIRKCQEATEYMSADAVRLAIVTSGALTNAGDRVDFFSRFRGTPERQPGPRDGWLIEQKLPEDYGWDAPDGILARRGEMVGCTTDLLHAAAAQWVDMRATRHYRAEPKL
jgi:hypothetical protein